MNSASELWYVQLSDGDVHRLTLDQLDEGFQAGHVGADTMVLPAGARHWTKLGELAGIDDNPPAPAPPFHASFAPPVLVAPPVFVAPPARSAPHSQLPRLLESHRPVSVDLSDMEFAAGLSGRSRMRWLMMLLGVAIMGGVAGVGVERPGLLRAFVANARGGTLAAKSWISAEVPRRLFGSQAPAPQITAAPANASVSSDPPAIPIPSAAPLPTAQSSAPSASPPMTSTVSSGGDTKAPVHVTAPKSRAKKLHAKVAASSDSPAKPTPSLFTTTGNKFDPLSSSIQ